MQPLSEFVANESIALVGNSEGLLRAQQPAGQRIDDHDIVVRMNLGLPSRFDTKMIGARTDILTLGRYWGHIWPEDTKYLVWMKLTRTGASELKQLLVSKPSIPVLVWTKDLEDECHEFVGAPPGSGIRMLWWLKTKTQARSVSCYGMDCWQEPSHWSGKMNTPNHVPSLEREAMLKLL